MEETAPFPLMQHRKGGKDGGATHLTPEGEALMKQFEELRSKVNAEADRCFQECFDEQGNKTDA